MSKATFQLLSYGLLFGLGCAEQPAAPPRIQGELAPGMGSCRLPNSADPQAALALYDKWKTDLLTSEGAGGFVRVRRPNSGSQLDSTNSEGIAYGMLLSVYANDQPTFDALWQYEQLHLGANGLMEWEIGPDGTVLGQGATTDGDEDMAFALVMADARWVRARHADVYRPVYEPGRARSGAEREAIEAAVATTVADAIAAAAAHLDEAYAGRTTGRVMGANP